jgi:putative Holliday junction resolvase
MNNNTSVLALDYGDKRVGLALASLTAKIASPYTTLINDSNFYNNLKKIIEKESITAIIVGYPRGLDGQITDQTKKVDNFIESLKLFRVKIISQDETLTSIKAENELQSRKKGFNKVEVDALAACYILEDWLNSLSNERLA